VAPPPGRGALRPDVGPGTVLAGRYRLEEPQRPGVDDPDHAQRWRAVDDVLARPVDVLLLVAGGRRAGDARSVLEAAAAAGTVVHPALARVYDAAIENVPAQRYDRPAGGVDVAYVVTEHVGGRTLLQTLGDDGPLEPADACAVGLAAAEALTEAHEAGVVHGGITPESLALTDRGPKLRDAAVAAALARRTADPRDDVRALAACLYAALTGRWPEQATTAPGLGLRPAPLGRADRPATPHQVRAAVPLPIDGVVTRALGAGAPPLDTAADLAGALRRAADAEARARLPPPPRRPLIPPRVRRRLPLVAVVALLLTIGVVSYLAGLSLGTVRDEQTELETLVESTPSPVPGDAEGGQRLDLLAAGVRVTAFDPPPGDGAENNGAVPNAVDGDPATAWDTERYDTPSFGGLKDGVGLLVDLGQPTAVEQAEVGLRPGTAVELRAADEAGPDAAAFPVIASVDNGEPVARLVPTAPVTARYVLIWITRLPPADDRFQASINELFFVRP
jgi:hypothetical protein